MVLLVVTTILLIAYYTLKNVGLNTTQPVLGKYWTEHMLGCFQPTSGQ